jgi:hypothetical protein
VSSRFGALHGFKKQVCPRRLIVNQREVLRLPPGRRLTGHIRHLHVQDDAMLNLVRAFPIQVRSGNQSG